MLISVLMGKSWRGFSSRDEIESPFWIFQWMSCCHIAPSSTHRQGLTGSIIASLFVRAAQTHTAGLSTYISYSRTNTAAAALFCCFAYISPCHSNNIRPGWMYCGRRGRQKNMNWEFTKCVCARYRKERKISIRCTSENIRNLKDCTPLSEQ